MDADAAPETEVIQTEDIGADEGGPAEKSAGGKKAKRTYKKVNQADYYNPAPFSPAKGRGGKGGSKGSKGGPDGEGGGPKGKGKGGYGGGNYTEPEASPKPEEEAARPVPSNVAAPGPLAADGGDASQPKGAKKKQMGKNREGGGGKGKGGGGGSPASASAGGSGGAGGGGGKANAQKKGAGGKAPRGPPMASPEAQPEAGVEAVEGPRPPGPQRPQAPIGKGAVPPGVAGMPMMSPYPYPMPGGYPYGLQSYGPYGTVAPMAYALPYAYVMPTPGLGSSAPPAMPALTAPGAPPPSQPPPPLSAAERQNLKNQLQAQIEYYFGMDNLLKDVHLRKHMNEEGWVPLSVIAGFTRIMSVTTDISLLADAVGQSSKLELDTSNGSLRLKQDYQRWILAPQASAANAWGSQP